MKFDINKIGIYLSSYKYSLITFTIIIVFYQLIIVTFIPLDSKVHGDERHFIETIRYFSDFDLHKVKDYKEVAPPLVFVIYAVWGKIFGFEIQNLRVLSLIIAFITFLLLHRLFFQTFKDKNSVILILLFFLLNPYIIGFNVLIFTDMLTLLFVCLFCLAVYKNITWLLFFSASSALLCRQYSIFILIAGMFYYMIIYFHKREKKILINALSIAVSMIPLLLLFIVWRGLAPQSGLDYWVGKTSMHFSLNNLNTYILMSVVYSFPIMIFRFKYLFSFKILLIVAIAGVVYFIFPVEPSTVTVEMTMHDTVGLFHRSLKTFTISYTIEHIIFYFFFVLGLGLLWCISMNLYDRFSNKEIDYNLFTEIAYLCFLLIMPFSYQVWEKYLIIVLPIIFIIILKGTDVLNANESLISRITP